MTLTIDNVEKIEQILQQFEIKPATRMVKL